jgi:hypothetical protein
MSIQFIERQQPAEYGEFSTDASHSKVKFVEFEGKPAVLKIVDISAYCLEPSKIEQQYIRYRAIISRVYPAIPDLYCIQHTDDRLIVVEQALKGKSFEQVVQEGDRDLWNRSTRKIFAPLISNLQKEPVNIGPFVSKFPFGIPVDLKPANVIITQNNGKVSATPIDFFPPLVILDNTKKYMHCPTTLETMRVLYSATDLEVVLARHMFETLKINENTGRAVENDFLEFCREIDPTGQLSQNMVDKVINSKHRCPHCPYCFNIS